MNGWYFTTVLDNKKKALEETHKKHNRTEQELNNKVCQLIKVIASTKV